MIEAAAMMARKKLTPSVTNAIKASPAGMFPAAAAKAGITMGSKLGQAITKSGAGQIPAALKARAAQSAKNMKASLKAGPSSGYKDTAYRGPVKESQKMSSLRNDFMKKIKR